VHRISPILKRENLQSVITIKNTTTMSSFQYYEFYAIDSALTSKEKSEVDNLSSRFSPTSRRAIFSYSYSNFRHDEEKVLISVFRRTVGRCGLKKETVKKIKGNGGK